MRPRSTRRPRLQLALAAAALTLLLPMPPPRLPRRDIERLAPARRELASRRDYAWSGFGSAGTSETGAMTHDLREPARTTSS